MNWSASFVLFGALQGVLIAILFFTNRKSLSVSSTWLSIICLSISLTLVDAYFYLSELYRSFPYLIGAAFPLSLVFCPMLYGYIRYMLDSKWQRRFLWHFFPALISIFLLLPFFMLPVEEKVFFAFVGIKEELISNWTLISGVIFVFLVSTIQGPLYFAFALRALKLHRKSLKSFYSSEQKVSLRWLYLILFAMMAIWLLSLAQILIGGLLDITDELFISVHLLLILMLYVLSYFAFQKRTVFNQITAYRASRPMEPMKMNTSELQQTEVKYQNSAIDKSLSLQLLETAQDFMGTHKPFLDSELSLTKLAERMEISSHHLSQAINQNLAQNFFDFVNQYRIQEAQKQLVTHCDKKIVDIAVDCGFNSKSAFYTAFKKFTDKTPGDYRRLNQ
ncbi:AraC family transcriptional regulator [Pleionea sp. CnH1-48]|uniref:helix-turn-helix domain-containing protein n=1 Tax=Pleionea sp. CnH1-48 TaxID=2954494 RepID=UPI002096CAA2|nr:AraC family transcriptional regulator [Pleionea sp. CnH1-48]MCO7223251.1 helix-turn-helix domain-containing protein [Pleionea sp. CnH1-48]